MDKPKTIFLEKSLLIALSDVYFLPVSKLPACAGFLSANSLPFIPFFGFFCKRSIVCKITGFFMLLIFATKGGFFRPFIHSGIFTYILPFNRFWSVSVSRLVCKWCVLWISVPCYIRPLAFYDTRH